MQFPERRKLTVEQAHWINQEARKGRSINSIANELNVNFAVVHQALIGVSYTEISQQYPPYKPNRKLSAQLEHHQVHHIHRLALEGLPPKAIARRFGGSVDRIHRVLRGECFPAIWLKYN